jgi:hypothetical protein
MNRWTILFGEILLSLGIIGISLTICLAVCGGGGTIDAAGRLLIWIIAQSIVSVFMTLVGLLLIVAGTKARSNQSNSQPPDEPDEE